METRKIAPATFYKVGHQRRDGLTAVRIDNLSPWRRTRVKGRSGVDWRENRLKIRANANIIV
jgi:hypothetical protein